MALKRLKSRSNESPLDEAFANFIAYLNAHNYSQNTIGDYQSDYRTFKRFLATNYEFDPSDLDFTDFDVSVMEEFILWMKIELNYQPTSISRRINCFKSFYNWLEEHDRIKTNFMRKVKVPKKQQTIPVFLELQEVKKLLSAPTLKHPLDNAVMHILLGTGLRRQEIIDLNLDNLLLDTGDDGLLRVTGKGNKMRVVPIPKPARLALDEYLQVRPKVLERALFIGMRTRRIRIGKQYLYNLLHRCLQEVGITRPGITLHKLRHTYATMMIESGANIKTLQEFLGHEDESTTMKYLHTSDMSKRKAVQQFGDYLSND